MQIYLFQKEYVLIVLIRWKMKVMFYCIALFILLLFVICFHYVRLYVLNLLILMMLTKCLL